MDKPDVFPELLRPQLATLSTTGVPAGNDFYHELKHDGFRLLCSKDGERVDFYTRRGHRWNDKFPAIAAEVRQFKARQLWLDGEIVVLTEEGKSCFGSLQMAIAKKDQQCLAYYVFDLMYKDGRNLCREPLEYRKKLLKELIHRDAWNLRYVDFQQGYGEEFWEMVCAHHLEGIVSKRVGSFYRPGVRSRDWLKSICRDYHKARKVAWKWWEQS